MVATVAGIHLGLDTHGNRPAGNSCPDGSTYSCSTHGLIYKSNYAGNSWATWATLGTSGALVDPMTTRGDVLVRNSSNVTARLAVGAAGKILSSDGTDATWGNGPMTTAGDIIIGGASGTPTRLAAGATSGHVLTSNGSGVAPSYQAGGAGGGLAQSFVGYNTTGGTWTTVTGKRQYCKAVVLAATSHVLSVDAYIRPSTDNITYSAAAVMADNSTAPGVLLGGSDVAGLYLSNSGSMPGAGRWFSFPIGLTLAAGTYWISVTFSAGYFDLANDASGTDQYFTTTQAIVTGAYPSVWAITTGAIKYSIRASILA